MGIGKLLVKVPAKLIFLMDGEMPHFLLAKHLILHIISEISISGETYRAIAFAGSIVKILTIEY